jgi:hypothetical protein
MRALAYTVTITAAAFEAVAATLPFGSAVFEHELDAKGKQLDLD